MTRMTEPTDRQTARTRSTPTLISGLRPQQPRSIKARHLHIVANGKLPHGFRVVIGGQWRAVMLLRNRRP